MEESLGGTSGTPGEGGAASQAGGTGQGAALSGNAGGEKPDSGNTLMGGMAKDGAGQDDGEGGTLLGRMNREQADSGKDGKPEGGADVPKGPEGYALQFAEGMPVDEAMLGEFTIVAHKLGLSKTQAQELADMYAGQVERMESERQMAEHRVQTEARKKWEAQIKESPTFEVDKERIASVLKRFGTPALYDLLDFTNMGSHPDFFLFMANVGKALGEPEIKGAAATGQGLSAAKKLYPNMN